MAGFFVSAPMANGTLTNDCVVGSLGPSWPSPCGSAPRGAAANRPSVADSASPIAPTKNTKEPARWRVFLCPRQWPTGLSPTTASLAHSGRPGPRPAGPRLAARLRIGLPWPIRRVQSRLPRTLKNPPDGGFFCVRANGQRDSHQRLRRWFTRAVRALALTGPRLTARLRIGRPWPIRRVQSRLPMLYRRTRPMAGFLLPAPLAAIGSHQRLRRWFTRAVLALALRVRASRCGCESAVLGRFGESHRALGGLSAGRVCAVFTIAARAAAPVQSKKMPDKAGEPYTC